MSKLMDLVNQDRKEAFDFGRQQVMNDQIFRLRQDIKSYDDQLVKLNAELSVLRALERNAIRLTDDLTPAATDIQELIGKAQVHVTSLKDRVEGNLADARKKLPHFEQRLKELR